MAENGRIVTNEKTGEQAWWDGTRLTPIRVQGDVQPTDIAAGVAGQTAPLGPEGANLPPPPSGDLIPPEAAKLGRERSVQEATQTSKMLGQNVVVPLAQAAATMASGGASLPVQALVGGGSELAAQALQGRSSPAQVGVAAALPVAARGLIAGGKAVGRGLGQMFAPGAFREAGTEATAKVAGQAADVVERAFAKPASRKLFETARGAGSIATDALKTPIDDAIAAEMKISTPDRVGMKLLSNLSRKFAGAPETTYDDVINEIQRLEAQATKAFKAKNNVTGTNLAKTADKLVEETSALNPAYRAANQQYLRERTTSKIMDAVRSGSPASKLNQLIDREASRVSGAFSKQELNEIRTIAGQVNEAVASAGEGFANRTFNAFTKPFSDMLESKTGRALLRNTLGSAGKGSKIGSTALASALQFWRAYEAQGGDQ